MISTFDRYLPYIYNEGKSIPNNDFFIDWKFFLLLF